MISDSLRGLALRSRHRQNHLEGILASLKKEAEWYMLCNYHRHKGQHCLE